jgi:histidyl-tRNA synthetase
LKKQFDFADKKGIPFLAMVGTQEMTSDKIPVKNLATGVQELYDAQGIKALLS